MPAKLIPIAIAYDFDGTLGPGNMQEHDFIPAIGMKPKQFWSDVTELAKQHNGDNILIYMGLMLERARSARVAVRREDFQKFGATVKLFDGVIEWFDRINVYGKEGGCRVEHYIISSGLREMVEGSPIGSKFKAVYASSFWYDHHGVAQWPALALNYTTKTQYLFRINKGSPNVYDHSTINRFVPQSQRPIPFQQIIYVGDGETDIPCFRLVKDQGGHSVAVYRPRAHKAKQAAVKLLDEGRVNFMATADYTDGSPLDRIVKGIIDKIAGDIYLKRLGNQQ